MPKNKEESLDNIRYLTHDEIDFVKWDNCIDEAVNAYIYAYSWYLDTLADDWDALVFEDYKAVFPLPFRKKMGIHYIYQPVFTQQLGLFVDKSAPSVSVKYFIENIPNKFKLIELNLNKYNRSEDLEMLLQPKINIELCLIQSYSENYANYSTNLKRNLKKAKGANLQISVLNKPDEVIRLFAENRAKEEQPYSSDDFKRLRNLMFKTFQKGMGEIVGCYSSRNELIAGAFLLHCHDRIIFLFSGNSPQGKENAALAFILDSVVQKYSSTKNILDFEGSNNTNLARFYSSFGAKKTIYNQLSINRISKINRLFFNVYKTFKKFRS